MTRRQRARERRAYNRWRRWARAAGCYDKDETTCSWHEWSSWIRRDLGHVPREYARVTGSRFMRAESVRIADAKAAEWAERHL